jgi:hypothetical protein
MSNGAAWLCRFCIGPDGTAWRNRGGNQACFKCKKPKCRAHLSKGPAASGCPTTSAKAKGCGGGKGSGVNNSKAAQQLEAENRRLRSEVAALKSGTGGSVEGTSAATAEDGISEDDKQAAKVLQKRIQTLKDMDADLRGILCEGMGGYAAYLAQLEEELRQVWAKQRSQKPLAQQKVSAENHLKRRQKSRDDAAEALKRLGEEQAALEARIGKQREALAEAETALQQAKCEAVAIAERVAAELRGGGQPASYAQSCIVTASTVKDFFKKLPAAVLQHDEGQQTIAQVMALLEKLDSAAQAVAASAAAAPAVDGGSGPKPPVVAAALAAASLLAAGGAAAENAEQEEDEEMDDTALVNAMPNAADQSELGALKARLKEQGIFIRCTRPKGKLVKK